MNLTTKKRLNDGREMPLFGLGVFRSKDGEETYNAVRYALDAGYRHIDTAAVYTTRPPSAAPSTTAASRARRSGSPPSSGTTKSARTTKKPRCRRA